ncbi:MAG: alkaline phosphatase family protein, partial [Spirochaetia bacterium]|nr:alkaline phosphatase family protein [Spirochaetia bacterium]
QEKGVKTIGVGKIGDIFNRQGLSESFDIKGNEACLEKTFSLLSETSERDNLAGNRGKDRFIFVNLVDTDMYYGHRRDIKGYFDAVSAVDKGLEKTAALLDEGDALIVTADHGCDPSFKGSDHTREYVPLLLYIKGGSTGEKERAADMFSPDIKESFSFASSLLYRLFGIEK